ncbi:hypothetical protein QE152_g28369 [Popillia japonica]|uniref:Uncharacterized protein n=1 Tax=Popillia japonica TaxID=7064 RepID=A0AAW1JKF0_POPJA
MGSTTVTVTATITKANDDDGSWVSSPKDTVFPETIPEESSSTEEEHVVIFRLPSLHESDGFLRDPSIYTAETSIFQLAMRKNGTGKGNFMVEQVTAISVSDTKQTKDSAQKVSSPTEKEAGDMNNKRPSTTEAPPTEHLHREGSKKNLAGTYASDVTAATFLDVAVLRCLFITQWQEEGIYWALHYMYNRLRDINEETAAQQQPRRRSNSLPIPKIEVSVYQGTENRKQENKDFMEVPEPKDVSLLAESPYCFHKTNEDSPHVRRASEKTKKRMKMADLKAFVETKLLSKSDKALEKIGQDEPKLLRNQAEYHRSLDTGDEHLTRPSSIRSKMFEPLPSNLVKGKSMPSLSCLIDELAAGGYIGEIHWDKRRATKTTPPSQPMANPIITVTEHTPTPSPDFLRRQGSIDSQLDALSLSGSKFSNIKDRKSSLTRSQTDSNITYSPEDIPEAPGSFCYITKEGDIDIQVVLKATHAASLHDNVICTLRVLEVILNLVDLLMDMGVLKQFLRDEALSGCPSTPLGDRGSEKSTKTENTQPTPTAEADKSTKPVTPHRVIMNIIVRVLKHLGCPHGCADGQRGPAAEFLRMAKEVQLLNFYAHNVKIFWFSRFLRDYVRYQSLNDILDFFHAYVGFCIDPSSLLSPLSVGGSSNIRGIEGQIISSVFKTLVTKLVNCKELKNPDNMGNYCDVRQLMTYIKEGHGGVFRRVVLSALIDTADRPSKKEQNIQTTRVIRHFHPTEVVEEPQTEPDTTTCAVDDKGTRKLLFKKRSTSSTCASLLETEAEESSKSLLETEAEESSKVSQSPLSNLRKKHHILTPRQSEKALGISEPSTSKQKSKSRLGGIVNWFKRGDGAAESSDNHDSSDTITDTTSFVRPPAESSDNHDSSDTITDTTSFVRPPGKQQPRGPVKSSSTGNVGQTLQKAKKRVEDRFSKFVLIKGKKKDNTTEDSPGSSWKLFKQEKEIP